MLRDSVTAQRSAGGWSYIELMVVCALLAILSTAVIPLARWDQKRRLESRLLVTLQTLRGAIDQYNKYVRDGLILSSDLELDQCALAAHPETCFPLTLEQLVEGIEVGDPTSPQGVQLVKFLARIPVDPIYGEAQWGLRSYQDDWDSRSWGGENVYDVYSLSHLVALDGSYYSEW